MGDTAEDAARKDFEAKEKHWSDLEKIVADAMDKALHSAPQDKLDKYNDAVAASKKAEEALHKAEEADKLSPTSANDKAKYAAQVAFNKAWNDMMDAWNRLYGSMGQKEKDAWDKADAAALDAYKAKEAALQKYKKLEAEEKKAGKKT
jgi:hypothetical protein